MPSKHKLKVKRQKRRARAMAREATVAAAQAPQTIDAAVILGVFDQHLDKLFEPKSPRDILVKTLTTKS